MEFPPRALELAADRRLGRPVRRFDGTAAGLRALIWVISLATAGALLVPAAVVYLADERYLLGVPAVLVASCYLSGAVWLVTAGTLRGLGHRVYLFEHGFVRFAGRRTAAAHWDELSAVTVAGLQRAARRRTEWRFTISRTDGRSLAIGDELPDVHDLGEVIVTEVTRRLVPGFVDEVAAGRAVRIGPFTVSPDGIAKDGDSVPWDAVREIGMSNGMVFVRRLDDPHVMAITAARLPNSAAFVALGRRLLADRATVRPHRPASPR